MKKFFSFAIFLLVSNFLFTSIHAQCPNPGGSESDFGQDVWKVNVYELGFSFDATSSWLPLYYSGYYNDSSLNFDSQDKWDASSDPTTAPGYNGCEIPSQDYMSWSAKREGFPCGIYRIDIINHDDYADLLIDGVRVWDEESLNSNTVVNAWTGALNSLSTVEFRIAEDEEFTNGALSFTYLGTTGSFIGVSGHPVVCTGQSYTLTSIPGASYAWSNGETTNPSSTSQTGSYFVTVTDDDGCVLTSEPVNISILPDAAPVAHITSSTNSTCDWEVITLSSDSSTGNIWSTAETTSSISINIPSDYVLTVTNSAGCFDQATMHISGGFTPPAPVVAESVSGCPIVLLASNGLSPGGRVASFNYIWMQVIQDIPETNFTIEMWVKTTEAKTNLFTAGNLYTGWDRDLYLENGQLQTYAGVGHVLNSGITINDGKWHHIALTVQTGVGTKLYVDGGLAPNTDPYDHSVINQDRFFIGAAHLGIGDNVYFKGEMDNVRIWSEARSQSDIRNNMALETPLSSTNLVYHCTMNGNINPSVGNNGITGYGPLDFLVANYYTYSWTGAGAPAPSINEIQSMAAVNGIYTVTATTGCNASPASLPTSCSVSAINLPSPIASNSGPVCENSSATLSVSGLAPGGQAASFDGSQSIDVTQNIPENNFTIEMWVKTTEAETGIFSVTSSSGGHDRHLFLVNGELNVRVYNSGPWNSGIPINDGNWHHIALTVQTGVGQKIYVDGNPSLATNYYDHSDFTWQDQFLIGFSVDAGLNAYFKGQIDNVRIWGEARSFTDINNNMFLENPSSNTNLVYQCSLNGNVNATVGSNGNSTNGISFVNPDHIMYTWSGTGAPLPSTNETQTTSALSEGGAYTVTASVTSCASSSNASTEVTVMPGTNYYPDTDDDTYGSSIASPLFTCTDPGSGYVLSNTDCNDGNEAIYPGAIDVCNGVDDNCNNVVDENAIVATIVAPTDTVSVCKGTVVSFTANSGSGITYQWMRNSVNIGGATNMEYATQKKGKYQVIETNAFGCTSTSASVKVTILQPPAADITALGNLDICTTGSVTLQANNGSGLTYVWTKGGDPIAGATNQSYTTNKKGTYHCIVSNSNGCSKKSNSLVVTKDCSSRMENMDAIAADLSLYPNPTTGRFMVDLKSDSGEDAECTIMVMNIVGQIIYAADASMIDGELQQEILLSSGTTGGIYMVRVIMNDTFYEGKLIVQY